MELARSLESFRRQGLGVAAISYDSREMLKHFSDRLDIPYPLLSDPDSKIIRAFGILNTNIPEGHEWYGIPFPGTYVVDEQGRVVAKYFEEGHRQRTTADSILVKEFNAGGGRRTEIRTDHLTLQAYAAQDTARPGNRITVMLEIELPAGMHLYAPGAEGYKPVAFEVNANPMWHAHELELPEHRVLYLEAIKERVPVYEGRVRIARDLTISPRLRQPAAEIEATFRYQACDERVCYLPQTLPLKFTVQMESHDVQRGPEELRKKP